MDFFPHRDISAPSETIPRVGASQQVFMDVCSMVHVPCSSQTTWTLIFHVYMFHVSIILRFPYFICIVAAPAHSSCCALDPKLFDGFSWWTSNIQCWPFARSPFFNNELVGGWPTPLKNDGVKVSWDDDMTPILMESQKNHVPKHQPVMGLLMACYWTFQGLKSLMSRSRIHQTLTTPLNQPWKYDRYPFK